jgi:predicted nucleotidyltransferase
VPGSSPVGLRHGQAHAFKPVGGQAGIGGLRYNAAMAISIPLPHEQIRAFCRKHRIRRMLLFGSVLREDFGPESDIDVLVEFEVGATPGWEFFTMADELADILGRPVDLGTPDLLSKFIRDDVLAQAQVIYEQAA